MPSPPKLQCRHVPEALEARRGRTSPYCAAAAARVLSLSHSCTRCEPLAVDGQAFHASSIRGGGEDCAVDVDDAHESELEGGGLDASVDHHHPNYVEAVCCSTSNSSGSRIGTTGRRETG